MLLATLIHNELVLPPNTMVFLRTSFHLTYTVFPVLIRVSLVTLLRIRKIFFLRFFYLFMRETERERERKREKERQTHRQMEKQAPFRVPEAGLDPRSPGSQPGLKAALNR